MRVILVSGKAQCVSGDTEFFNGFGWKKISNYKYGDKVLQFNEDNSTSLVKPLNFIVNENSKFVRIKNDTFEAVFTPDHNIVYGIKKYGRNKFYKKTLNELRSIYESNSNGFSGYIPATFFYKFGPGKDLEDDEIRLKLAIFADGTFPISQQNKYYNCSFNLKKIYKIERLEYLLKSLNIQYKKYNCKNNFVKFYFHYENCKHFDETWYNCNAHQIGVINDEIVLWDGNRKNRYLTNNKFDADFIQFVFTACGRRSSIKEDNRVGKILKGNYLRKNITYMVHASTTDKYTLGSRHRDSENSIFCDVDEMANSYCFTVPSGMLVLRYKDHIFITGNCGKDTTAFMMKELLEKQKKKVLIIHYADNLKLFAKNYFGWSGQKDEKGRELLQWFGTDVVRKNYEDTWVDMIVALLKGIKTLYDYIIIPDVRFPNEIDKMCDNFNCVTVRVIRPNFDNGLTEEQKKHPSERALGNYPMEYELINDGDLEKLLETTRTFLKNIG